MKVINEMETSFYRASAVAVHPAQKDTETTMNARQNMKSGSTIEEQLSSIQMSQHERNAALHAAGIAEMFVGTILWVCGKVQRPRADVFAKPNLKY